MKEGKNWHVRVGVLGKVGQYHLASLSFFFLSPFPSFLQVSYITFLNIVLMMCELELIIAPASRVIVRVKRF